MKDLTPSQSDLISEVIRLYLGAVHEGLACPWCGFETTKTYPYGKHLPDCIAQRVIHTLSPDRLLEVDAAPVTLSPPGARWCDLCGQECSSITEVTADCPTHGTLLLHETAIIPPARSSRPTAATPVPMILFCPSCSSRHIDVGEYATKPHHTHACQSCGVVWRPALGPTVGVQFLPGFKNETHESSVPLSAGQRVRTKAGRDGTLTNINDGRGRVSFTDGVGEPSAWLPLSDLRHYNTEGQSPPMLKTASFEDGFRRGEVQGLEQALQALQKDPAWRGAADVVDRLWQERALALDASFPSAILPLEDTSAAAHCPNGHRLLRLGNGYAPCRSCARATPTLEEKAQDIDTFTVVRPTYPPGSMSFPAKDAPPATPPARPVTKLASPPPPFAIDDSVIVTEGGEESVRGVWRVSGFPADGGIEVMRGGESIILQPEVLRHLEWPDPDPKKE